MKQIVIVIALLCVGCGERRVVHTWTSTPTVEDVMAALTTTVWYIDDYGNIGEMKIEHLIGATTVYVWDGERTAERSYICGSWKRDARTVYYTKREADSALCAQLTEKIKRLECGR